MKKAFSLFILIFIFYLNSYSLVSVYTTPCSGHGCQDGKVYATLNSVCGYVTFLVPNGNAFTFANGTYNILTDTAGTYTFTFIEDCTLYPNITVSNTQTVTVTISQPACNTTVTIDSVKNPTGYRCNNGKVFITGNVSTCANNNPSYGVILYKNGVYFSSATAIPGVQTQFNGLDTGSYNVVVTDLFSGTGYCCPGSISPYCWLDFFNPNNCVLHANCPASSSFNIYDPPSTLCSTLNISSVVDTVCSATSNTGMISVVANNSTCVNGSYTWRLFKNGTQIQTSTGSTFSSTTSKSYTSLGVGTYFITHTRGSCIVTSPTITISVTSVSASLSASTTATCKDATPPTLTFIGNNGTPPYVFTYKINGGTNQTISSGSLSSQASLPISTSIAGTFTYSLVSVSNGGCNIPQSATATITVAPTTYWATEVITTCAPSYLWQGTTYTSSGIYTKTYLNLNLPYCSEVYTLNLTITPNPTNGGTIGNDEMGCGLSFDPANIINLSSPTGGYGAPLEYFWYSGTPTSNALIPGATNATYDPGVINGISNTTIMYVRFARTAGCTNSSYLPAQSNWVTKTFNYVASTLTVSASETTICSGKSTVITADGANTYTLTPGNLNGSTFSVSPIATTTYTVTATTAAGCTFTTTITINVNATPSVGVTASNPTICSGYSTYITATGASTYSWVPGSLSGSIINVSPTFSTNYVVTGTNSSGCTATASTTIIVNYPTSSSLTITDCNSYTWLANGTTYSTSGVYYATSLNTAGCVHTSVLNLTINNSSTSAPEIVSACDSYAWHGTTYTTSGTFTYTSLNFEGCVNTATLNLTINHSTSSSSTATVCDSYIWSANNLSYGTSGIYTWTLQNSSGCDSILSLHLIVNYSTTVTTIITACDNYTWLGNTYTTSGFHSQYWGINSVGCPSNEYLFLFINPTPIVVASTTNPSICPGTSTTLTAYGADTYSWIPGSFTGSHITVSPSATTTYTVTGTKSNGCLNTATITITVKPLPTVNTVSNQVYCDGATTSPIPLTGTPIGVAFNIHPNAFVGLNNLNGVNTIPSFIASTGSATLSITPIANSCLGTPITSLITVNNCPLVTLNLKFYIQGYYLGNGLMQPMLYNDGIIINPYSTEVDYINVELHSPTAPYDLVENVFQTFQTNGTLTCNFSSYLFNSSYYIVIRHQNALTTWSANPVLLTANTIYDFSTSATKAYGNNQIDLSGNGAIWALYSGDINQDENIDLIDASILEYDVNNFQFGYLVTDLNGDGNVDLLDSPTLEANINNFIFSNYP